MSLSAANLKKLVDHALHQPKNLATEQELNEHSNAALLAFQRADVDFSDSLTIPELRNLCSEMGLPMEDDEEEGMKHLNLFPYQIP